MLPDSRRPRRLPRVMRTIAATPMPTPAATPGDGGDDLLHGRGRGDGDGHDVVDQQRARGDQRGDHRQVGAGNRVGTAAGWIGDADLPIARGDHGEEQRDRNGDREAEHQRPGAGEDQDAEDLLGRVGRGRDRVRAEDRERLRLRQALGDVVVDRERPTEQHARRRASVRPAFVRGADAASWRPDSLRACIRK